MYKERLTISKPVSLVSDPSAPAALEWQTTRPYESTICVLPGGHLILEGIRLRHISSKSGSGIGLEGGSLSISQTSVHDCIGNGVVLAGALTDLSEDSPSESSFEVRCCCHP